MPASSSPNRSGAGNTASPSRIWPCCAPSRPSLMRICPRARSCARSSTSVRSCRPRCPSPGCVSLRWATKSSSRRPTPSGRRARTRSRKGPRRRGARRWAKSPSRPRRRRARKRARPGCAASRAERKSTWGRNSPRKTTLALASASRRRLSATRPCGKRVKMNEDARQTRRAAADFPPFEYIPGPLDAGVLLVCDHASNALPAEYGSLGLPPEAFGRHIAYDIGAADLTRALAGHLGAPAVLSTFSRLLIDPNRGPYDPTLIMRYSDGAIVPGNARLDTNEIESRRELLWGPYRNRIRSAIGAMLASGEPPAVVSIHSFTPIWRGVPRPWKVGVLWDRDDRVPRPLIETLRAEPGVGAGGVGDNEPYDGALAGDTIDAVATPLGLANALIEIRQDLVDRRERAAEWAQRLARLLKPIVSERCLRAPRDFGSRARRGRTIG